MENLGWISIHRKIQQNPLYFSEPFTRIMAWIDLLLLANHKEAVIYVRGNRITIKRGQFAWGEDALSKRWRWSRGKVRRYLKSLENEAQIVQQKSHILSLYTILNYEAYQKNSTTDDTTDGQQIVQQTDINNNNNNVNNDNNRYIDNKLSIQPTVVRTKIVKQKDEEVDRIISIFEEVNGSIPVDQAPRRWAYHIKRLLTKYLTDNNSSLKPSESLQKFLVSKREANMPIIFNKLQTIYYHLRSTVYKNEKHKREQGTNETTKVVA